MNPYPQCNPPGLLKNPFVQSYLASTPFRALGKNPMSRTARETIIETSDQTRLQGFYTPHPASSGLVLLLHGWEGSAFSTYVRCTGRYFFERGYSVFRLNLRDHGDTHHLNNGMFFGSLFREVFDAVVHVARLEPDRPYFMIGFSLGGNYILRLVAHAVRRPVQNLAHAVAVSPVIDPEGATRLIDSRPTFRWYFLRKWRRSLVHKQQAFPGKYDFSDIFGLTTIYGITAALLKRYGGFANPAEYFRSYAISSGDLVRINVPTTVITAKDDPIIPPGDFVSLARSPGIRLSMQPYGGHNGFIESLDFRVWYQPYIWRLFDESRKTVSG